MKPVFVLLGLGALIAGGVALSRQFTQDGVVMRRGGAYRFYLYHNFDEARHDLHQWGFASLTFEYAPEGAPNNLWARVQGVWVGDDGVVLIPVDGMSDPEFLGMVTERQTTPDAPMQGPSQTTSQSGFFINFPAQGLVNLNE